MDERQMCPAKRGFFMKKLTGGQAIMESLIAEGVDVIFGYPGGAIMPTYDALYDYRDKIRHVLMRHEQGASHAAEGYARATGKTGVCLATSGPGATNLVTGIADAMMDSTPMVCITGQVTASTIGTDAFQEADVIGITAPITKWNYQITDASEIPEVIAKAFYIAHTGRPGPVVIDITKNAQFETFDFVYKKVEKLRGYQPNTEPNMKQVKLAAELLNSAKKPFMFVGHGVLIAGAEKELMEFAEKSGIPVASTLLGLSAFPTNHPLYTGMLGMHGNYGPNMLTNQADVILAVGMRFDDRVTSRVADYAKQAKIIHVDIDPAELNKIVAVDVPIVADAKKALQALIPLVTKKEHKAWVNEFTKCKIIENKKVIENDIHPSNDGKILMAEVINLISEKTKGRAIIVSDVGQHQMITARYYGYKQPDSSITSGGSGTMGFALPASLGAKIGMPNRDVIAVIGDGSFQMTIQEMATIAQEETPVKIIILNNGFLGMVRQWQQMFFEKRYSFVKLKNPDFVMLSKGFGIKAERVEKRESLGKALDRLLSAKTAYFLDITVLMEGNVFPMIPTGAAVDEIRLE